VCLLFRSFCSNMIAGPLLCPLVRERCPLSCMIQRFPNGGRTLQTCSLCRSDGKRISFPTGIPKGPEVRKSTGHRQAPGEQPRRQDGQNNNSMWLDTKHAQQLFQPKSGGGSLLYMAPYTTDLIPTAAIEIDTGALRGAEYKKGSEAPTNVGPAQFPEFILHRRIL
jgi:hypothetical protein